jgi:hypothetical protein
MGAGLPESAFRNWLQTLDLPEQHRLLSGFRNAGRLMIWSRKTFPFAGISHSCSTAYTELVFIRVTKNTPSRVISTNHS